MDVHTIEKVTGKSLSDPGPQKQEYISKEEIKEQIVNLLKTNIAIENLEMTDPEQLKMPVLQRQRGKIYNLEAVIRKLNFL